MNIDKTTFKIADFINKEIPSDILDQLKVFDRISHVLKPTTISAISQSEQKSDSTPTSLGTQDDVNKDIDKLIDEVKDLENLVEQLEDMNDEHLKDMSIPPVDDRIASAIKQLDPTASTITKEVLDKALAIMTYLPMMSLGQDPVLAALVGDGTVNGPWMECNEITSSVATQLTTPPKNDYEADESIKDQTNNITNSHEKRMLEMMLETLLMLWWNMLWPKIVVDAVIINPARVIAANPIDSLAGFFMDGKNSEGTNEPRFKKKSDSWLLARGNLNQLLKRIRNLLLCKIPPKLYKRYKPMVDINCTNLDGNCPPKKIEKQFNEDNKNAMTQLSSMMDELGSSTCVTDTSLLQDINSTQPTGFGASPECSKAAKTVLDAVLADALTPPNSSSGFGSTKNTILNTIKGVL